MENRQAAIEKVAELLDGARIAMLTTVTEAGELRSRPMAMQSIDFDGDLWFFTEANSWKIEEIDSEPEVNVAVVDTDHQRYVSLSGMAEMVRDREKIRELWSPMVKAWFPGGPDDPNLALLKVEISGAEYWDGPGSKVVQLLGIAKATLTGQKFEAGDHGTVSL